MIDLRPEHLEEVLRILAAVVPGVEVRAFGSRTDGSSQEFSDLDLVLCGDSALDWRLLERLKDALSASDLPFHVDVLDWHAASAAFRQTIAAKSVPLRS